MQENTRVSIIVPVYNVEPYLRKCVDSIIDQTYQNLEIILVDDGSPDNCPQICDEYKEKDKRVVVIHKSNGGLSDARNAGLDAATGEYVTFIDGDDWYETDAIEKLVRGTEETNADIVCMGFYIAEEGTIRKRDSRHISGMMSSEDYLLQMCGKKRSESVCDKMFKSQLLEKLRFRTSRLNEDFLFLSYLLLNSCTIYCVDYWGYNYFKRSGSITHSNLNSLRDGIHNAIELKEKAALRDNKKAEYAFAEVALFQARTALILLPDREICNNSKLYMLASQTIKNLAPYLLESGGYLKCRYQMQIVLFRLFPKSGPIFAKRVFFAERKRNKLE